VISPGQIEAGTLAFRRTNVALFASGFSTFALFYCVQPLLPVFAQEFHVSPAQSSLALSLTTGVLAFAMLLASALSEHWGRKPMMVASILASAGLTIAAASLPGWHTLLITRALLGITLSGLPAVAMAYLTEEIHPRAVGLAMGLYIGGSGIGGMAGRLLTGVLTDYASWRVAMGSIGALALIAGLAVWRNLPRSSHFEPHSQGGLAHVRSYARHLGDPGLRALFVEGFLLMGGFVTVYNYITFRLLAPPYNLSQAAVGAVFSSYVIGTIGSTWIGHLAGRLGRRKVLWVMLLVMLAGLALTFVETIWTVIAGVLALTFGFFGAHSISSSWVGLRARSHRAQASALYLFGMYMGASIIGTSGGYLWTGMRWTGVTLLVGVVWIVALMIALRLSTLVPLVQQSPASLRDEPVTTV
jgi:YNFM family putative membrane transporter